MKWWLKATAQSVLSRVPMGNQAHEWLQMKWGEFSKLEKTSRFKNAAFFLRAFREHGRLDAPVRAVEIGTGWVPAVPLSLALAGVTVDTFDVVRLIRPEIYTRCVHEIGRTLPTLAEAAGIPLEVMRPRFEAIANEPHFARAIASYGGSYRAPWDTTRLPFADGAVDVVFSNLVFQNIHVSVLEDVVREMARVLRPGGLAVHRIGMDDEYATVDPGRGPVDFLRYSRSGWDLLWSHNIKYCNRLRCSQFIELFERHGLAPRWASKTVDRGAIPRLRRRGVAAEFRRFSWEDLATVGLEIVLEKPRRARRSPACTGQCAACTTATATAAAGAVTAAAACA